MEPVFTRNRSMGFQEVYKFSNGYGASVVGGKDFVDHYGNPCYDIAILTDVAYDNDSGEWRWKVEYESPLNKSEGVYVFHYVAPYHKEKLLSMIADMPPRE